MSRAEQTVTSLDEVVTSGDIESIVQQVDLLVHVDDLGNETHINALFTKVGSIVNCCFPYFSITSFSADYEGIISIPNAVPEGFWCDPSTMGQAHFPLYLRENTGEGGVLKIGTILFYGSGDNGLIEIYNAPVGTNWSAFTTGAGVSLGGNYSFTWSTELFT